jgi:hypothetical protein
VAANPSRWGVDFAEYLRFEQEAAERELELWSRTPDGWKRRLAVDGTLSLKCGAVVDVRRLYEGLPA